MESASKLDALHIGCGRTTRCVVFAASCRLRESAVVPAHSHTCRVQAGWANGKREQARRTPHRLRSNYKVRGVRGVVPPEGKRGRARALPYMPRPSKLGQWKARASSTHSTSVAVELQGAWCSRRRAA